jgi:hypothetical protein
MNKEERREKTAAISTIMLFIAVGVAIIYSIAS